MINAINVDLKGPGRYISSLACLLAMLLMSASVNAQTSSTDGTTPPGIAPGSPAGSYALSGFENINLFNGNLNFSLPLLTIRGRGEAQYTMTLNVERRWTVDHQLINESYLHHPQFEWWRVVGPGYGPGRLIGRQVNDGACAQSGAQLTGTLTRLTFTTPDGTEYELRDTFSDGGALTSSCLGGGTGASRGKVFITADGTSATFISDANIIDYPLVINFGSVHIYPSGFLMFRDGTRYRIDHGKVMWIRDRNGNRLTCTYDTANEFGKLISVSDSLNRLVTIEYNVQDGSYGQCDRIIYKGVGGAVRIIRVATTSLGNALRSGYQLKTYRGLFPTLDGSQFTTHTHGVVSSVWLPDGNRRYRIYYNSHSEVARVELPTGGAFEYDWGASLEGGEGNGVALVNTVTGGNQEFFPEIYRRVLERRVYKQSGMQEGKIEYSKTAGQGTASCEVSVFHRDATVSGNLLARQKHRFHGNPVPANALGVFDYPGWKEGRENNIKMYNSTGQTVLREMDHTWQQRNPASPDGARVDHPRIIETVVTLKDTSPNKVSKQTFAYDQFNNKTEIREFDFGSSSPGPLRRIKSAQYLTNSTYTNPNHSNLSSPHLRSLPTQEQVLNASSVEVARTTYEYDNYTAGLTPRPGISGHDSSFTTAYTTRGNVTAITKTLLPSTPLVTRTDYDIAGNVVRIVDARNNPTTFDFSDRFGFPDGNARLNSPPSELGAQTSYAFPSAVTNALFQTAYRQVDYQTGNLVDSEDVNGVVESAFYNDVLDRPTQVVRAAGTAAQNQMSFIYNDPLRIVTTTSDQNFYNDNLVKAEALHDGLGRQVEVRQYEPDAPGGGYIVTSRQEYDAMGRPARAHNPHRATGEDTYGWTDTTYDSLSRTTSVQTFDRTGASTGTVITTYNNNVVTVRDQANKQRRSTKDGLGRLASVDELHESGALYATTNYTYDTLDNLTLVQQGGQTRTFVYDSLSRLKQATNPENGTVTYDYDNNGNLRQRTDSRSPAVITTYEYDVLNRVTSRIYNNSTPPVSFFYDSQALPAGAPAFNRGPSTGRLVAVTYGSGSSAGNYMGYDSLGRVVVSIQRTDSQNYQMSYGYDLAGNMTSESYPSGRVVNMQFDAAGRLAGVKNQATGLYYAGAAATDITNRMQYTPHGAISMMKLGNGLAERISFNSRLQPTQVKLGTTINPSSTLQLDYTYNTPGLTNNNGNLLTQAITIGSTVINQSYSYDHLNRLSGATEAGAWFQTYSYDLWGNRAVTQGDVPNPTLTPQSLSAFNTANNRLHASLYDGAGNQVQDAAARSFAYDAENRQVSFNNGAATYGYDGEGRRVKKVDAAGTTVFVYNTAGQLVAEYKSDPVPPPAGGGGTSYLTADHLGSTRAVTKADGAVKARYDYLPFGEEIGAGIGVRTTGMGYGQPNSTKQKFTSKERDDESSLDYFGARYYSGAQGRFTGVDPQNAGASPSEPQSWNGYAYAGNNPLINVDPNGLWYWLFDMSGNRQFISDANADEWRRKDGVVFNGGKIFDKDGNQLGTYRRMWDDSASLNFNLFIYGREGMVARAPAMKGAIAGFAVGTAAVGATGGLAAYYGGFAFGGSSLTTLGLSEGGTITGIYGTTTVATLQSLASSGGPTVQVVTNLTRAPAAGHGLSTATGPGAEALANSFARAGGQLFRAEIPKALLTELERTGLAQTLRHASGALEVRFVPEATRFIVQFFK